MSLCPRRAKPCRAMATRRRRRCARATIRCEPAPPKRSSPSQLRPSACHQPVRRPPRAERSARTRARRRRRRGQESGKRGAARERSWRRQSAAPAARCAAGGGSSSGSRVCVLPSAGLPRPPAGLGLGRGLRAARDSPAVNARAGARATPPDHGEEEVRMSILELEQCMCSGCICGAHAHANMQHADTHAHALHM